MESVLNDNLKQTIFDSCKEGNWLNVAKYMKKLFPVKINETTNELESINSKEDDIQFLSNLLNIVARNDLVIVINVAKEVFRCLRNCVAFNLNIQNYVMADSSIISNTYNIFKHLITDTSEYEPCLKMLLVYLTNTVVDNIRNAEILWTLYEIELSKLLGKNILVPQTAALIYNLWKQNKKSEPSQNLVFSVLNAIHTKNESEFLIFLLEDFIKTDVLIDYHYFLKSELRIIILTEIKDAAENRNFILLSPDYLMTLLAYFNDQIDIILKTMSFDNLQQLNTIEFVLLADILAICCGEEKYCSILQNDNCLLINIIYFLKAMHASGKDGNNCFTPIRNLGELEKIGNDVKDNPYFGLKGTLIRIIGNLAWKSNNNQNTIRELECIPILLDCCNIDARNPFIMQWVIFAIRNICEKNKENQAYIASMQKQGVVDSATLNEIGVTLVDDGANQIKIAPLPESMRH